MKMKTIFLDGRFIKASEAKMASVSREILKGRGAFETMRSYDGKIFAVDEHLKRLERGCVFFKLKLPFSKAQFKDYLYRTMKKNNYKNARIRLTVWKKDQKLKASICVYRFQGPSAAEYQKGFDVTLSPLVRRKTKCSHLKTINYSVFLAAYQLAKQFRFDEAILLNSKNELVEGSRTNLFYIKNKTVYTPAISCGCLNGITRRVVLRLARGIGLKTKVFKAKSKQLFNAHEAFLTNSTLGVMPVATVDGKRIGNDNNCYWAHQIQKAYLELVYENG